MPKAKSEAVLSLTTLLTLTPEQILQGDLPTLPDDQINTLNAQEPKESSPVVVYSLDEERLARRGLWVSLNILKAGIENRTDHPRVVPHRTWEMLSSAGNFIIDSHRRRQVLQSFDPVGSDFSETFFKGLGEIADYQVAQKLTKAASWEYVAQTDFVADSLRINSDIARQPSYEQLEEVGVVNNANRARSQFWRNELAIVIAHPAVHQLIEAIRTSDTLPSPGEVE